MLLSLEVDGAVPLYQQLRDRVVEAIASGALRRGDSLPATRQLAADLGINMHTGWVRERRAQHPVCRPSRPRLLKVAEWAEFTPRL